MFNNFDFAFEPRKIKERIKVYERRLVTRKLNVGTNTKHMVGPYYLMLNDTSGAIKHYEWFEQNFPDLIPEPFQGLCWVLALIRVKQFKKALYRLKELHLSNVYMIPNVLELKCRQIKIDHVHAPWSAFDHINNGPTFLFSLWRNEEKKWLLDTWLSPEFQNFIEEQLLIDHYLTKEKDPQERRVAYLERALLVTAPVSICPMRHLKIV